MNVFNRKRYLRQLRMHYSGDRDCKEQFLQDIEDSLDCYCAEHPYASKSDIYRRFGSPKQFREEYEAAQGDISRSRKQRTIQMFIIVAFAIGLTLLVNILFLGHHQFSESYGQDKIFTNDSRLDNTMPYKSPQITPALHYKHHPH